MRSGTSFFDWTLFKKTVTRWWPIWAAYLTFWVFVMPVNFLINDYSYSGQMPVDMYFLSYFMAIVYTPVCAMAVLSHLYSTKPANFYGALPVRREGIFLTQYLAGLSFSVVPNLIAAALTALVYGLGHGAALRPLLIWFGVSAVELFFFFTFAVFCGMFAGHVLALPAFYLVFNALFIAAEALVEDVLYGAYYGFAGFGIWVERAVVWLTPAAKFSGIRQSNIDPLTLGVYSGVAVVMLVAAFFLYKRRRMESAGDVVAVRPMRPVFKYGVAACSGLFLGYVTATLLDMSLLPYTVVAWTVVGYFAGQMILDKTFRVFGKWQGALVVGAVAVAVMAATAFDITGFETRVPEAGEVKSVRIYDLNSSCAPRDSALWANITLTESEDIGYVLDLHRAAISERDRNGHGVRSYVTGGVVRTDDAEPVHVSFELEYELEHGSMKRAYDFWVYEDELDDEGSGAWALERLFDDRDLWRQVYGLDGLEKFMAAGGVPRVTYEFDVYDDEERSPEREYTYFRGGGEVDITRYEDVMAVVGALTRDFEEGNVGRLRVGQRQDAWSNSRYLRITYSLDSTWSHTRTFTMYLPKDAKNTLATVYALLPGVMEEQGLS